jgi:hypothetical protein
MMELNSMDFITSGITSHNPNEKELKLAKERLDFCLKCDFRKEGFHNKVWSHYCGPCGCSINEKIFTIEYGSCPLGKWNIVESNYVNHLKIKNKTII